MIEGAKMQWDGEYKAPAEQFRVIATDCFPWPHEDFFVGDFPDLAAAKIKRNSLIDDLTIARVYNDKGEQL
jgi:hypothetical protein